MAVGANVLDAIGEPQVRETKQWVRIWRAFRRNKLALAGGVYLVFLILFAILGPELLPYKYTDVDFAHTVQPPSRQHLLGTDSLGHDILARLAFGARISLSVAVLANLVILFIGVPVGMLAGYVGGWVDMGIMRLVDALASLPNIMLMIAIKALLDGWMGQLGTGPLSALAAAYDSTRGLIGLLVGFAAGWWLGDCRIVRGLVLSLNEREYVIAARAIGATGRRVMLRHLLPNVLPMVAISMALGIPGAMMTEAGLSYLGLGVKPPMPSWGSMISEGMRYLLGAPHILISPALTLAITTIALNFFADGLRDAMDPWMKGAR